MKTRPITALLFLILLLMAACGPAEYDARHPMAEQATFRFADPELEISLIASEPDIISPVDMAWAPDGSLYVVEMTGYPITENHGKVKKLTDPDGDGHYTLESIFADNLNFPASAMYYKGGLLVADAPDILYLYDSDGDGVADKKEVFITGFEPGNQQFRANSLQWGRDNWIYGANGRAGGTLRFSDDTTQVSIASRDFKINPRNTQIKAISGLSQFGLAMDNWGNRFISVNNRFARQVMLEQPHLSRNPALTKDAIFDTYKDEHDRRVWTLLTNAMRFNRDPIGYFTSLSGLEAYRGNLLGPAYEGSLFAGESVQAAVIRRHMEKDGAVFRATDMEKDAEFLTSTDDWFHPVNFSNGPDGALYLVDFYRRFVEHPEWAYDEKEEGIDWNQGQNHGRIWRIARKANPLEPEEMRPNFNEVDISTLVGQLESGAGWRRDMAQQLLVEGQKKEAAGELEKMLDATSAYARVHAYWTLDGLGLLTTKHIVQALGDKNNEVVLQGIELAKKHASISDEILEKMISLANSRDGDLRFKAILALGDSKDRYVQDGLISSATQYADKWTQTAILSSVAQWPLRFAQEMLAVHAGSKNCDEKLNFFRQIGDLMAYSEDKNINRWVRTVINKTSKTDCSGWALVVGYMTAMEELSKPTPKLDDKIFAYAVENLRQIPESPIALLGTELLRYTSSENTYQEVMDILINTQNLDLQIVAIQMFSNLKDPKYTKRLFENIQTLDPKARKALIVSARNSTAASHSLLNAIQEETVQVSEISEELRYALLYHDVADVSEKAETLLSGSVNADRDALVKRYESAIKNLAVDLESGAAVFNTNCTLCHSINGKGGNLGPDLTNIGSRSDEILLTSILDPSRMVSWELKLQVITTKSGKVYSGMVSAETITSITIKQSDGKEHSILKENIKKRSHIEQSIMPEGYERIIDEKSMANLIAYLRNPV
ncbi:PVC-type heme-binding CxxCH protein [Ulvibacterium sp.]|uniref:PVC-type heme-binding CxxCH protein n=1 Tax=Ulvibacterium sp. TaxID=2665914 RepID=UPI002604066D|nr:PVC-type heme-binding CxxCH protein [Ulvibacterium sp.]